MGNQLDRDINAVIPGIGATAAQFARVIEQNTNINLRVGMPAEVLTWSPPVAASKKSKPAMVSVRPHFTATFAIATPDELTPKMIAEGWTLSQENGGYVVRRALPDMLNVPVHYPGHAGMYCRGPLSAGETGYLHFADRSIDKWIQVGGPGDPGVQQFHDLSDAIFVPGLRYGTAAKTIDAGKHVIGSEDGSAVLAIDVVPPTPPGGAVPPPPNIALQTTGPRATVEAATEVLLGIGATLGVARLNDTVDASAAMTQFMADVVATLITIAAAVPVAITPPIPPTTIGQISGASTKVKAE